MTLPSAANSLRLPAKPQPPPQDPQLQPVNSMTPPQALDVLVSLSTLACQQGALKIDVTIRDGHLDWNRRLTKQDPPNFILTVSTVKLAMGLTSRQWTQLQNKLAVAINKYNTGKQKPPTPKKEKSNVCKSLV